MALAPRHTVPPRASLAVLAIAAATILIALGFQFIGGFAPCHLCLIERYAYYFGVPVAALAYLAARRGRADIAALLLGLIALAFLANTILGVYHFGVEQAWWKGPSSCTGSGSTDWRVLAEQLKHTAVVKCDQATAFVLGVSLSFWNAAVSALLCLIAAFGAYAGWRR